MKHRWKNTNAKLNNGAGVVETMALKLCLAIALTSLAVASAGFVKADILNQTIIYNQDPWDTQSQLGSDNCRSYPDGSMTCDTRPKGQVWVETYGVGYN